jgi:hypothetical protein
MQTRELLLAGLLGTTVVGWYGHAALVKTVFEPLANRRSELVNLQIERSQQQTLLAKQLRASKQLGDWSKRSLPPDPSTALALYQNWLIEWATAQGLTSVQVTPGRVDRKPRDNTYYVIPMTVKANARLDAAVKALYDFHASGLLHRVRLLSATSAGREGDPELALTMEVEGLALVDGLPRTKLLAAERPSGSVVALAKVEDYAALTAKNLFVRGYNGPPAPPPPPAPVASTPAPPAPPSDGFDALSHVYLVAAIDKDGRRTAWLYDRATNGQTILEVGQSFPVEHDQAKVAEIGRDFITFVLAEKTLKLELGHHLRDAVGPTPEPVSTNPQPDAAPTPKAP